MVQNQFTFYVAGVKAVFPPPFQTLSAHYFFLRVTRSRVFVSNATVEAAAAQLPHFFQLRTLRVASWRVVIARRSAALARYHL